MAVALAKRTLTLTAGGDNYYRTFDPLGAFFREHYYTTPSLPVVTVITPKDQMPALGTTCTIVFKSDRTCSWRLLYSPNDDATITVSDDTLTCTITVVIPANTDTVIYTRGSSEYVGVSATTLAGSVECIDRLHIGASEVRWIGEGQRYASLADAIVDAPAATRFIIKDGAYTNTNQFIASSTDLPNGDYITYPAYNFDGTKSSTRYYLLGFATIMAETPHNVIFDGGGTVEPINIVGNHPYEFECTQYDTDAGTTQFQGAPTGTLPRIGIAIKGIRVINSSGHAFRADFSRYIHFQHCSAVMSNADKYGFYFPASNDCLAEFCYATGNMAGAIHFYKFLRSGYRRCLSTIQNNNGTLPIRMFALNEGKHSFAYNLIDIDGKDAYEWKVNANVLAGSQAYPEADFNIDGHTPDFSTGHTGGKFIFVNNYLNGVTFEAWEQADSSNEFTVDGVLIHDCVLKGTYNVIHGGPALISNVSISRINNQTGVDFFSCIKPPQRISNLLIKNIGWTGSATANQGYVWTGRADLKTPDAINNFVLADSLGTLNNPVNLITFSNQHVSNAAEVDGMKYLTRLETGSSLYSLNVGVKSAYATVGKQGAFWLDSAGVPILHAVAWADISSANALMNDSRVLTLAVVYPV